ncbi:MAG: 3TM-type holin, partial [Planctomycetota bacterium]
MAIDLKIIKDAVEGALGPVSDIIDNLTTSREEKDAAKIALAKAQGQLESDFHAQQASVIIAEATGASWLQRNHRPLTVMTFVFIVAWNYVLGPIGTWGASLFGLGASFPVLEL